MNVYREAMVFVGIGLLFCTGWWHIYVKPADEFRITVIDCMIVNNNMSETMYNQCVEELKQ
jgi:hypothetical protein